MIGRNKVVDAQDVPTLQWANGRNEARKMLGVGRFASHVGWYTECDKDEAFDDWLKGAGLHPFEMRHPRESGPPAIVRHWDLGDSLLFFPLTSGPVAPTVAGSLKASQATAEAGIALRWTRGDGERSKMAIRGYLAIPVYGTYPGLLQISVKSRMTDELMTALVDHVRVCEVADSLVDRAKHPDVVGLWELALPLGPGDEQSWGRGETTMVTPIRSGHPDAPDLSYLRGFWRDAAVVAGMQRDWPGVQMWAREYATAGGAVPAASYEGDAL